MKLWSEFKGETEWSNNDCSYFHYIPCWCIGNTILPSEVTCKCSNKWFSIQIPYSKVIKLNWPQGLLFRRVIIPKGHYSQLKRHLLPRVPISKVRYSEGLFFWNGHKGLYSDISLFWNNNEGHYPKRLISFQEACP